MELLLAFKKNYSEALKTLSSEVSEELVEVAFAELTVLYSDSSRAYHNINHIKDCFANLAQFSRENNISDSQFAILTLAIWYHDSIYDTKSATNEEASVKFFTKHSKLLKLKPKAVKEISTLILETKTHDSSTPNSELFLDIDLSILGASSADFNDYERNIRKEYSWVPEKDFARERKKLMNRLAKRKRIFKTEFFHSKLEKQAKRNLIAYLKK